MTSENVKTTRRVSVDVEAPSGHTLYTYDGSTGTSTDYDGWTDKGVFYIPIEGDDYVQRARITVGYTVDRPGESADYQGTVTKDVILHEQKDAGGESLYGPGKWMDFNIKLGNTIPLE